MYVAVNVFFLLPSDQPTGAGPITIDLSSVVVVHTKGVLGRVEERALVLVLVARESVTGLLGVRFLGFRLSGGGGGVGLALDGVA